MPLNECNAMFSAFAKVQVVEKRPESRTQVRSCSLVTSPSLQVCKNSVQNSKPLSLKSGKTHYISILLLPPHVHWSPSGQVTSLFEGHLLQQLEPPAPECERTLPKKDQG